MEFTRQADLVTPDPRWNYTIGNRDALQRVADSWRRDPRVATEVSKMLTVARDLFVFSIFNYDFGLVAVAWSLLALEVALRDCLNVGREEEIGLKALIGKAQGRGWFSDVEAKALHAGRQLRDRIVHSDGHKVYSPGMVEELLASSHAAIGDLYSRIIDEGVTTPSARSTPKEET